MTPEELEKIGDARDTAEHHGCDAAAAWLDVLVERIKAVEALHHQARYFCAECVESPYPCATASALGVTE